MHDRSKPRDEPRVSMSWDGHRGGFLLPVGHLVRGCPPFAHRAFVSWGPSPWTKHGQPAKCSAPSGRSQPRRSMPKPSAMSTAYPRSRSPIRRAAVGRRWATRATNPGVSMPWDSGGTGCGSCPPGTSAGSISPIRRHPMSSSHVPAAATSRARPASAYRPAGGDRPRQPSAPGRVPPRPAGLNSKVVCLGSRRRGCFTAGHRRGTAEVHRIGRCTVYASSIPREWRSLSREACTCECNGRRVAANRDSTLFRQTE